jgi:chromosome segregation ATPase
LSKGAKQSILILIVLFLGVLGFAAYTVFEKQKVEKEKTLLSADLTKSQESLQKYAVQVKDLQDQITKREQENSELNKRAKLAEGQVGNMQKQVDDLTDESKKWKERVDNVQRERDEIMAKLQEAAKKQQDAEAELSSLKEKAVNQPAAQSGNAMNEAAMDSAMNETPRNPTDEQYWAKVLQDKAALQVKVENLQQELGKNATELIDLKQSSENLKIQLDALNHDKDELGRDIKYKADMINNLSLELARARNDKKFIADNFEKLNQENKDLRGELKKLVTSKGSLEKSIVKITEDRNQMQKQLEGTEGVIQSKIDEIWEIKNSIDETFQSARQASASSNEVELPPIVVNSNGAVNNNPGTINPGINGKVVSINPENNFVIVDLGEKSGVNVGDSLSVYRDSKYIGKLEVIQVRKDISAADIKDQWAKIQVGDVIR